MSDFDPRKARLLQELLGAVRRGDLPAEVLQGFLLHHLLEHPDTDLEPSRLAGDGEALQHTPRPEAERLYREARNGFLGQGSGYDSALVDLDLARLYLEQERCREVRQLAEEMLPVFRSQDIHREAAEALRLFRDAVRQETVSVDLIERITSYLEQARSNPNLHFGQMGD